ncbi:MAG: DUF3488 and transglutaminase-like domain-containing protein [Thermodesulfobacteriota bacterium]
MPTAHDTLPRPKRSGKKQSLQSLQWRLSIAPGRFRMFRVFLAVLVSLTLVAVCIENGLPHLFLLLIPVIVAATNRSDYGSPFLFRSELHWNLAFAAYLLVFPVGTVVMAEGQVSMNALPTFLLYFTFGVMMVRIVSPLSDRNISQLLLLSVAMILVNCILTNHILFGMILPFYLFALMGTLLLFNFARSQPPAGEVARLDLATGFWTSWYSRLGKYVAVILPIAVLLFIFLPRPFVVIPGLSGSIGGAMAQMQQRLTYRDMINMGGRKRIAFKVNMQYGTLPAPTYWRGKALELTDGRSWWGSEYRKGMTQAYEWDSDKGICYDVVPFRLNSGHLYVSGFPRQVYSRREPLFVTGAGEVLLDTPFVLSNSYRVWSMDIPLPAGRVQDPEYTNDQVVPPRIKELARQWIGNAKTAKEKADAILAKLGTGFRYRLIPQALPENVNPLEDFLFVSRAGNCEHFAGSMGLMLRAAGVPTRLVEGFAGFDEGSEEGELVVRFAHAHVWVEALLDDTHWTALDPTPPGGLEDSNVIVRLLSDVYDRADNVWIKNVIHFDRTDQARMLEFIRDLLSGKVETPLLSSLLSTLTFPLVLAAVVGSIAGFWWWIRRRRQFGDLSHIYLHTMQRLVRLGAIKTVHPWYEQNFRDVAREVPHARELLARFRETYLAGRFGSTADASAEDLRRCGEELLACVRAKG